jgi:hypothetical protein
MTKEFKLLIEELTDDEFVNYIVELTRQNNKFSVLCVMCGAYSNSLEILLSSFNFHDTVHGWHYWNRIVIRIRERNKPITALATDTQIKL